MACEQDVAGLKAEVQRLSTLLQERAEEIATLRENAVGHTCGVSSDTCEACDRMNWSKMERELATARQQIATLTEALTKLSKRFRAEATNLSAMQSQYTGSSARAGAALLAAESNELANFIDKALRASQEGA